MAAAGCLAATKPDAQSALGTVDVKGRVAAALAIGPLAPTFGQSVRDRTINQLTEAEHSRQVVAGTRGSPDPTTPAGYG